MKLDFDDFLDINGNFYTNKADAFIHYGLVELAGKRHTLKIDEVLYYYNYHALKKERDDIRSEKQISRLAAKMLTPYLPLESLDDETKRIEGYTIPTDIVQRYDRFLNETSVENIIRVRPKNRV